MGRLVGPKVFLVGASEMNLKGVRAYLEYTGQQEFLEDLAKAEAAGVPSGLAVCSLFAKLCYKTVVPGKNANVEKTRPIKNNLEGCWDTGHGSVFEHCSLNFLATDLSRIATHELVRHRAGTAYSQTSGRYCRLDSIDLVWDPILDPVKELFLRCVGNIERTVYLAECTLGLRKPPAEFPNVAPAACFANLPHSVNEDFRWVPDMSFDMTKRKQITSAIRRIAPNGQANEIGFTLNVRAIRHTVQLRTSRFAEREIRDIFGQVYHLIAADWPTIFYKARTRLVDGLLEVYGMRSNPYDVDPGDPAALEFWTTDQLSAEVFERVHNPARKT
jgi:thymidylate synthase (FAD)